MSVRSIFYRGRSDSERRVVWGTLVLVVGSVLLALITVGSDHWVLRALRAVIGFAFLTVVPGSLLRALLRIREASTVQILLNTVGLSLLYSVGLAVLIDTFFVGIAGSLEGITFASALVLSIGLLTAFALKRGTRTSGYRHPPLTTGLQFWLSAALLTALPLLSVVGTYFVNTYSYNGVTLCLIAIVAVLPILLWTEVIPRELEAYAIFCAGLAVLYHTTLISPYIWGWDTHYEYGTALQFLRDGYWAPSSESALSSLLSVTLLSALYSNVTGLSLTWVFKLVYPVVFALMPLGIYAVSRELFADRSVAVLSPFVAIFYYGFFKEIPGKQAFAETFLVLLLVALVATGVTRLKRRVLVVAFLTGLVFSHYATALLFLLFFAAGYAWLTALRWVRVLEDRGQYTIVRPMLIVLFGALWLFWFMYTADGLNFERVVSAIYQTFVGVFDPLSERSGIGYATRAYESPLWIVQKGLYAAVIGLSGVGVLAEATLLLTRGKIDARGEFATLGAMVYGFLGSSAILTYSLGFDRVLQISLVVLAPFAVLGAKWLVVFLAERVAVQTSRLQRNVPMMVALLLVVMFLFSSGAAFAVSGEAVPKHSIGLDTDAGFPVYTESEVSATRWADEGIPVCAQIGVYSDRSNPNSRDGLLMSEVRSKDGLESVPPRQVTAPNSTYMYVSDRPLDLSDDLGNYIDPTATRYHAEVLTRADVIYDTTGVRIYRLGDRPPCTSGENSTERTVSEVDGHR